MSLVGVGMSCTEPVQRCLEEANAVLLQKPDHPYAREMAANCYMFSAELARDEVKIRSRSYASRWSC